MLQVLYTRQDGSTRELCRFEKIENMENIVPFENIDFKLSRKLLILQ